MGSKLRCVPALFLTVILLGACASAAPTPVPATQPPTAAPPAATATSAATMPPAATATSAATMPPAATATPGATAAATPTPGATSTAIAVPECQPEQAGPGGEKPTNFADLTLADQEVTAVKALNKNFRVGTFWQVQADTSDLMQAGMRDTWAKYGLPIASSASTFANWDAATQVDQIETLLATKPDALVGILVDQTSVAPAIKKANDAKVPIVFWDLPATGADYSAIATSNGRLAGCRAADAMAAQLGGSGSIAVLPMKFAFFPTDQRVAGFKDRIASTYPGIKIVEEQGATVFADGQAVGEGLLQAHPDLKGIFASWQDPAMGVVAAARTLNRKDLVVTTVDLSDVAAREIASCGILKATAAQLPYDEGEAEAMLVAKILANSPNIPKYVVTDTPLATHDTLLDVYKQVFHKDAPDNLKSAFVSTCGG